MYIPMYMYGTYVQENTCVLHTIHVHVTKVVTEEEIEKKGRKHRPNKLHRKAQTNTTQNE